METEIWRTAIYDDEVYEGLYQVSNLGNILSLNYRNTGRAELMNPWKDKDGYLKIGLRKNRKTDFILVHRLVAQTFIPNPENLPQVNHKIDTKEGKTINMVFFNEDGSINKEKSTIEWCDGKYNHNYGTINQRISKANTNGKCSKPVLQLSLTGEIIHEYPSARDCERNGFEHSGVIRCCNGKQKTHKGFKFMYI